MISSEKNIDTIVQLIEALKKWVGVKAEILKIDAADKGVRIFAALVFIVMFLFFLFAITILLDIAIALAISPYTGLAWAFVIMAAAQLIVFLFLIILRKRWIVNPMVRFFSTLLESGADEV